MLRVDSLVKIYESDNGEVLAVDEVSFEVEEGEFFTLLGPSGCGKTTTMRCIAGLENVTSGRITIDGVEVVSDSKSVPTNRRPVSMVFQSYAIWPHMTVVDNVSFPLSYRHPNGDPKQRLSRQGRREAAMDALRRVQLDHLADRRAPYLSGGQQQRVALARALVSKPKVLLLDEPLSNLDAKLREEMRREIKELTSSIGITTIYVTHDQSEALAMSDRIAVMSEGVVIQLGSPRDIYLTPVTSAVARSVGSVNMLAGRFVRQEDDYALVTLTGGHDVWCRSVDAELDGEVQVMIRPELVDVHRVDDGADSATAPGSGAPLNVITGTVRSAQFSGDHLDCYCDTAGGLVRAKLPPDRELNAGDEVLVEFDRDRVIVSNVEAAEQGVTTAG